MQLPLTKLGVCAWAWSPASDAVLCADDQIALFVSADGATARQQHGEALPSATTSVVWGSAGHVAVSGLQMMAPCLVVCAVSGPPYDLHLLHCLAPGSLIVGTCFDAGGLLLFWAAHEGGQVSVLPGSQGLAIQAGPVSLAACDVASGACRRVRLMDSAESVFRPFGRKWEASMHLCWSPDGAGLLMLGPPQGMGRQCSCCSHRLVQRPMRLLRFLG